MSGIGAELPKEAEEAKVLGNHHFKNQDFSRALEEYNRALDLAGEHHVLLSNRSATRHALGDLVGGLEDAVASLRINPTWEKGFVRKAKALEGLGRVAEARVVMEECVALNPKAKDYEDYLKQLVSKDDASFYQSLTAGKEVEIKDPPRPKGKGTFSKQDFKYGEVVFTEEPLAYFRSVGEAENRISCSYCLRAITSRETFEPHPKLFDLAVKNLQDRTSPLPCEKCTLPYDVYCGETCRAKAWAEYHRVLCPGENPAVEAPLRSLVSFCRETERSNPLMVTRIFAAVYVKVLEGVDPRIAFRPYQRFVSFEASATRDQESFKLAASLFQHEPRMKDVVTLANFRKLNGAMLRNAQRIVPKCALHTYFDTGTSDQQKQVLQEFGMTLEQADQLRTSDYMSNLTAPGSGLFSIANCTNHSCLPNVASVSQHLDKNIDLVAIRDIKKGDEIHISYIDETLPLQRRREILSKLYLFHCECELCALESSQK